MSIESPKTEELIIKKEGVVFDDFDVSFFDDAKELTGEEFEENLTETKKTVEEILGSKWDDEGKGFKIYLFTDADRYKEYLKKNFPEIPHNMATFDQKTNSVFRCGVIPNNKEFEDYCRAQMFSGVGHEMAHLHPFFGGVGNEASMGWWGQEMVCVFIEDKIREKMGSDLMDKLTLEEAKKLLEKVKNGEENFSLRQADTKETNYSSLERLFYPWLEKKYGMEKLRQLWVVLFKEKKEMREAIKEVCGEDIGNLEKQFKQEVGEAQNYEELVK